MGEIIIKVPGDVREVVEVNLPFDKIFDIIKKEVKKEKIKQLVEKTFNTLRENKTLEMQLEKEWHEQ